MYDAHSCDYDDYSRDIQVYFDDTKQLLPNSPDGNLWIDVDTDRRAHFPWVSNVRQVWYVVDIFTHSQEGPLPMGY